MKKIILFTVMFFAFAFITSAQVAPADKAVATGDQAAPPAHVVGTYNFGSAVDRRIKILIFIKRRIVAMCRQI